MTKSTKLTMSIVCIILVALFIIKLVVNALEPHGVQGYIFMSNGITQVPTDIPVTINDTNSSDFVRTQTSGPPIASGFYSVTINGSDNDTIIVHAWNATHYGQSSAYLLNISQSPATYVNVSLNLTRPSETNVTIIDPPDGSIKNLNRAFYVKVNISIIGGQNATNCNATLTITNSSVFVFGSGETSKHVLGNISLGSSVISQWNITSTAEGKSDFIAIASCGSDDLNFDNSTSDRVYNVTAQYIPTPEPHGVEGYVFMSNGITQAPSGVNVSINDTITGDFVKTQTYGPPIASGFYSATVNGTTGDTIIVRAWNTTTYGTKVSTLLDISESPATYVNVTLNLTRPSETNVTILQPVDFTVYLVNNSFYVIANISIIGGQNGINCSATISFSNTSVIQLGSGETYMHNLGNISLHNTTTTSWNLTGILEGKSNITVSARCDSDSLNLDEVNLDTVVNITFIINRPPIISQVVCENPIILNPGTSKKVVCNATVTDPDNVTDIIFVNSSFYDVSYSFNTSDDNNLRYTNNSCFGITSNATSINYSCSFSVLYYANNGTWVFNISAIDSKNNSAFNSAETMITELYAVNVSTLVIDFGELEPRNTSQTDVEVSINNYGNKNINLTLEGFGLSSNDNLSMACSLGNISIYYEKYATSNGTSFNDMVNMTSIPIQIVNLTLYQRTDDASLGNDSNSTFWKLYVPPAVAGKCNGTVIFTAIPT